MALIQHRVNAVKDLLSLKPGLGAEIDLRSRVDSPGRIHLSHDAWVEGDDFETWLRSFVKEERGPLILNTKEDGLEDKALELLAKYQISEYFFLDTALPTLVRHTSINKNNHFAVRYSKWEPESFAQKFVGLAQWLWVDCFQGEITLPSVDLMKSYNICIVSPELQGGSLDLIGDFLQKCQGRGFSVCTKRPDLWQGI